MIDFSRRFFFVDFSQIFPVFPRFETLGAVGARRRGGSCAWTARGRRGARGGGEGQGFGAGLGAHCDDGRHGDNRGQSRSSRTYEDALVALNTLITRKADAPITDPVTGVLNWQTHFQSLFRCLEVCARSLLLAHSSLVYKKLSHTLAFRISFATAFTLPSRTSGDSFPRNFRILDFVVWSFALVLRISTSIL